VRTETEIVGRIGAPQSRERFNHDDPGNAYFPNRFSREQWKGVGVTTPPDLIDAVPVGTRILLYNFRWMNSAINPTGDVLLVFVDDSNRIVGWIRSQALMGHEDESYLHSN
jgi:hypothetical protein